MKIQKKIDKALEQPELYNDDELKYLKDKKEQIDFDKKYAIWDRKTNQGFSNDPEPDLPELE